MDSKPTYEELEQRVKELEQEAAERRRAEEELLKSEQRYRNLVERANVGFIIIHNGKVKYANTRLAEMFGHTAEDMIDTSFLDYVFPDERPRITDIHERRLQGEDAPDIYEMAALHKDGRSINVEITAGIIAYRGQPATFSFVQDITERKRAEERLLQEISFSDTVINSMPGIFFVFNSQGYLVRWNTNHEKVLGLSTEEMPTFQMLQVVDEGDRELASQKMQEVFQQGHAALEVNILTKKGDSVPYALTGVSMNAGDEVYLVGAGIDMTERKRAEEALRESEKLYRLLADNVTDVIWVRDMNLRLTYVSPSITNQTGYTVEETMNRTLEEALTPDSLKLVGETIAEELEVEKHEPKDLNRSRTIELKIKCKDGPSIWTEVKMSFLRDQLGNATGIIGVTRDITERKHLEAQLQQAQKMEAIGTLAGGIAHDFNNILGGIIGYTELAQAQISEEQPALARDLSEVLKAGGRARELVQQILAFSRQTDQQFKPVKMNLIVKEALKLLRASLPAMIEITQNIKSDAVIWGEPTQLHQIIMNLCTNASYAMRESGGVLSVDMEEVVLNASELFHADDLPPGRYIKLVVSDTGYGMDSNTLQRLFDPYFTTKETTEGTGLGLSVTHGIVKSHGGAINVESALGDGSAFTILIPLIDQDTKENQAEEIPIPKGSERILFVDDEELFYDLVKRLLEDLGYEVVALQSSLEALKTFQTRPDYFDLVITDQTMPKLTGVQLASELIKIRPGIPIILCTGFSEQVSAETAADFGISEFVMKPVNIRKLAETIRKVLDGGIVD